MKVSLKPSHQQGEQAILMRKGQLKRETFLALKCLGRGLGLEVDGPRKILRI